MTGPADDAECQTCGVRPAVFQVAHVNGDVFDYCDDEDCIDELVSDVRRVAQRGRER